MLRYLPDMLLLEDGSECVGKDGSVLTDSDVCCVLSINLLH